MDADAAEFIKPTVWPDLQVHCDAKLFLAELNRQLDDGDYKSTQHAEWLEDLANRDGRGKYIEFSRNFGKGIATSAGFREARGDAGIMIDADLQQPVQHGIGLFLRCAPERGGAEDGARA